MNDSPPITRWNTGLGGRSRTVSAAGLIWTVANAAPDSAPFADQADATLRLLDEHLAEAGSHRSRLLSVQVLLADLADKPAFDLLWLDWIGDDPAGWPQRSCVGAGLAPGLRVEIVAMAARGGGDGMLES
ncbi:MAG: Rid family hydrolase [Pseudolysinimonas sp.]